MSEQPLPIIKTIAIAGGTGKEGKGLAYRWAKAGYQIIIGSRQEEKAIHAAAELNAQLSGSLPVKGMVNLEAVAKADLVVMTVPFAAHRDTLLQLKEALQEIGRASCRERV